MADEVQRALGRIEGKLDSVLTDRAEDQKRLNNHSNRIKSLELWRSWTIGACAAVGALWAIFSTLHGK